MHRSRSKGRLQCLVELILKPCQRFISGPEPLVVVIDALDKCRAIAEDSTVVDIVTVLAKHVPKLPSSFRIFITSRPMDDLQELLQEPHVRTETIGILTQRNLEDIAVYARYVL